MIAGVLIVLAVTLLEKLKLDDPVGAVPVHLVCGTWGTLAVGIFGSKASWNQFFIQVGGIAVIGVFCLICSYLILITLKKTIGIRVSREEEIEGLDVAEHGMNAYPDFRLNQH